MKPDASTDNRAMTAIKRKAQALHPNAFILFLNYSCPIFLFSNVFSK